MAHNCVASKWYSKQYAGELKPPVCEPHNVAHTSALMYPLLSKKDVASTRLDVAEKQVLQTVYSFASSAGSDDSDKKIGWWVLGILTVFGIVTFIYRSADSSFLIIP